MVLRPLEFVDCLLDSPYFRENLHNHEREVEGTSKSIKLIVNACRQLIERTRELSKAHRLFATSLSNFQTHFSVLGSDQTDDEADLESSLMEISTLLMQIEDEREHMLNQLEESFIKPMDRFRKTEIGNAKEEKKKFDKQTAKYCASLERYLGAKAKSLDDKQLEETTDALLRQDYSAFVMTSMNYVKVVQEVQERKKFIVADSLQAEYTSYRECAMTYTQKLQLVQLSKRVEILESLLRFMNQQMVFYHLGYEIFENFKPYTSSLQTKIQKLRAAFESTTSEAENLKKRMLMNPKEYMRTSQYKGSTLTGYLLIMKKQKTVLNAVWSKHFCEYSKDTKVFKMVQYSQSSGLPKMLQSMEPFQLRSCVRLGAEVYDRRFCFTIMLDDNTQKQVQLVMQAPDENELRLWLDAMEGKEPIEQAISVMSASQGSYKLNRDGYRFIQSCINAVESRGLTEAGLYRVVGLTSKVDKLLTTGLERDITMDAMDPDTDLKVVTSAIKQYFRRLVEPLMTFELHSDLILAAKQDTPQKRAAAVHMLVHRLPDDNFTLLRLLMQHLYKVACHSSQNLMTVSNLGVCFGPTLLRQREETMAAIMDIKFCNVVVEIMIEHYHQIFETAPLNANIDHLRVTSAVNKPAVDDVLGSGTLSAMTAAAAAAVANRQTVPARPSPPRQSGPSTDVFFTSASSHAPHSQVHTPQTNRNGVLLRTLPGQGQNTADSASRRQGEFREMPIECDGLADNAAPEHNSNSNSNSVPTSSASPVVSTRSSRDELRPVKTTPPITHRQDSGGSTTNSITNGAIITKSIPPPPPQQSPAVSIASKFKEGADLPLPFIGSRSRAVTEPTDSSGNNSPQPSQAVPRRPPLVGGTSTSSLTSFNHTQAGNEQVVDASPELRRRADSNNAVPTADSNTDANSSPFAGRRNVAHVPRMGRRAVSSIPRKARALYDCEADTEGELSFKTGDIIDNIRESSETGWLEGSANGRFGLVPANFVVFL